MVPHRYHASGGGPLLLAAVLLSLAGGCGREDPATRLERANVHYAQGDYRIAAIEVRNVLQQEPDNRDARLLFGRTSLALGDIETAAWELARARDQGASPWEFVWPLATALAQLGRGQEALAELDRLDEHERDADWLTLRGEIHASQGELGRARESFRRARALDRAHYPAMVGEAHVALLRQAWDEAHTLAARAVTLEPERAEGYVVRGGVYLQTRNLAAAERDFSRASDLLERGRPTSAELDTLLTLAQIQLTLHRIDALEDTAARIRVRAPDSAAAHYVEAAADYARGRIRDANVKLQRAAVIPPTEPAVLLLLGATYLELGNLLQAEEHLTRAVNQQPDHLPAVRLLAETRRRQGRTDAALEGLQRLAGAEEDASLLALRGLLHLEAGRPNYSVPLLERALQELPGDTGLLLQLARAYLAAGRTADAADLFGGALGEGAERALEVAADLLAVAGGGERLDDARRRAAQLAAAAQDPQALLGAGLFLYAVGDWPEARRILRMAADAENTLSLASLLLAGIALTEGDTDEARELYQVVAEHEPQEFRAWLGLAHIAVRDLVLDEAEGFARRAAEVAPTALAPHLVLAQLAFARRDLAGAQAAIEAAQGIDEGNPDVETLAGILALEQQQPVAALGHFRRAADAQPRRADRWLALARAERASGQLEAARASLRRAMELAPGSGVVRYELGETERRLGNVDAARRLAQGLQTDLPDAAEGYFLEGRLYEASRNFAAAALLFDQAYVRRPSFEAAVRSHEMRRQGALDEPEAPLSRWLEVTPQDIPAWLLLAQSYQAQERADAALAAYERVIALEPNHAAALNNAAWLYNAAGAEQAVEYARRAFELAPDVPSILDTYGWALVRQGQPAAALGYLREAASRAPEVADIQYHLAYALAQIGEQAEARAILQRLVSEARDGTHRERAEALLAEL